MAKRDDSEVPRRGRPKRSSGGNAPPPPSNNRMEMMLAAAATAESAEPFHAPHDYHQHQYAQQAYPQQPQQPPPYHSYVQLQPSSQQMGDRSSGDASKRKRVKKSEDEWVSAAPVAASAGGMSIGSLIAPQPSQPSASSMSPGEQMVNPAPSSNMHSISSLTSGPPPPEFKMPVSSAASLSSILSASVSSPVVSASSPSASVFQAVPTVIHSFAETERRRNSSSNIANGGATNNNSNINIGLLTHGNGKSTSINSSITSRGPKPDDRRGSGATPGRAPKLTMLDLFYPNASGRAGGDMNGSTRDPSKSLKRKRRVEPPASGSSSGRPGRRSNDGDQLGTATTMGEYDMMRFGVDSAKLIPQGLVDRVDAKMDRTFISRLIRSHVENWIKRAGFGNSFFSEATTLLIAYYPCHYPTLLDEVLACFLFKRPEVCCCFLCCYLHGNRS